MLRVAIPNKGVLSQAALDMLRQAGYATRRDTKDLYVLDEHNGVEFFYLRPRDIATYVGAGALDVGITGRDFLLDSETEATEVDNLQFGRSKFRLAGPEGKYSTLEDIDGLRVATSYPKLLADFLAQHDITVKLVHLDGAVENAIRLGVADVVADVVETGTTLRYAGLHIFGPIILASSAVLIGAPQSLTDGRLIDEARVLSERLQGVRVAREYVLLDYDVPKTELDAAIRLTPGLESPTVSPLARADWVAVRAMAPREHINDAVDELYKTGARAILVSTLNTARI
ncbi:MULTISPECIES: ATP phosphoribosyltransferase [unclassified Pseudoclavibacter]|uniref:ATP phosphoribosyltransferase n=1 Tax=unclassified Pseudoclavibacter TaxID=2615177 RepID=UPI0013011187|nr:MULTISPECIES: ATP phosphoribosyltransferase [unclassified Pseudoclavibacter]KAB1658252.1 ATP phosphoribosyltransferase [Pseudoclavibacter sp. CFCC 11306]KAB1661839.1 ATP phosphoribosyltransferase [Pseudoclavibacter sp. CFCC 13796]